MNRIFKIHICKLLKKILYLGIIISLCGCTSNTQFGKLEEVDIKLNTSNFTYEIFNYEVLLNSTHDSSTKAKLAPKMLKSMSQNGYIAEYNNSHYFDANNKTTPIINAQNKKQQLKIQPKKNNKVKILSYHCINDKIEGVKYLYVSPKEFEKQMKFLKDNNYHVITFDQIDKAENIERPVVITFDDGYEDNYTYAHPILKKYNYKAVVFLVVDLLDRSLYFKKDQLKDALDVFSFQSHTMGHKKLSQLPEDKLQYQLSESQKQIKELTQVDVSALAYPYGDFNQKVESEAKKYYKMIFTVKYGYFQKGDSLMRIPRIGILRNDKIADFKKKIEFKNN